MVDPNIATLSRQSGLMEATQIIANNIANAATPGFKAEGTVFSEYVAAAGRNSPSLSMGYLSAHSTDFTTGALQKTGGTFDFAIEGQGFFKVQTPAGDRLTRAGNFALNAEGTLVDMVGNPVMDDGGSTIEIPPNAVEIIVARDGTLSVDGEPFSLIGVFEPRGEMERAGQNYWRAPEGDTPLEFATVLQGHTEQSNVDPVAEFATLIMAQRHFEAGQTLTEQEHERLSQLISAIRQQG